MRADDDVAEIMRRRRDDRQVGESGWRFDKRITLDTLVAIAGVGIVLGIPIFLWGRAMEQRVQTLEIVQSQSREQEKNRELDARDQRIVMLGRLDKLDDQVTQLRVEIGRFVPLDSSSPTIVMGRKK